MVLFYPIRWGYSKKVTVIDAIREIERLRDKDRITRLEEE
jgi:hypothetical protein